jgi:hypothetical protein
MPWVSETMGQLRSACGTDVAESFLGDDGVCLDADELECFCRFADLVSLGTDVKSCGVVLELAELEVALRFRDRVRWRLSTSSQLSVFINTGLEDRVEGCSAIRHNGGESTILRPRERNGASSRDESKLISGEAEGGVPGGVAGSQSVETVGHSSPLVIRGSGDRGGEVCPKIVPDATH